MQIIANADKGESLFQELADARGAEQKQSKDYVVLARMIDQFFGSSVEFRRSVHVREFVFVIKPHRHAEIVLSEEKNINAGDRGNLGDILDARSRLHLQRNDAFVVPVAGVAEESSLVHAALREVNRARADGRIFHATDGDPRFFSGIDVGDEDTVGAHIERLLDSGAVIVSANTDQRFCAPFAIPLNMAESFS